MRHVDGRAFFHYGMRSAVKPAKELVKVGVGQVVVENFAGDSVSAALFVLKRGAAIVATVGDVIRRVGPAYVGLLSGQQAAHGAGIRAVATHNAVRAEQPGVASLGDGNFVQIRRGVWFGFWFWRDKQQIRQFVAHKSGQAQIKPVRLQGAQFAGQ